MGRFPSGSEGSGAVSRLRNLLGLARRKPALAITPSDVAFAENKWRLLRYRARPAGRAYRTPILMVPSLINRHYVLDLAPGKSFVEFLVGRGHDVFIIDWGTPGDEDRWLTFDDICGRYLGRAIRRTALAAGVERIHLLGYCLGGTLTAIHLAAQPERIATHVAVAAPIRFADAGIMSTWTRTPTFDVGAIVEAFGNVPWPLMQASFHLLKPTLGLAKAVALVDRAWDDEFVDGFLATEAWGNDNVSFPGEAYRRYIEELYRGDALVEGRFRLDGVPARLENITAPTALVTFEHDYIVPRACADVMLERIRSTDVEHIHMNGGHVGAVVSRKAAQGLWPKLADWWAARDGYSAAVRAPGPRPLDPSMNATAFSHSSRS
jgi:polyhydroxyalkanoate synthase